MRRNVLAATTFLVSLAGPALAAPVNLSFQALVSFGMSASAGPFQMGDTITVSFGYDTTQAPTGTFGNFASYSLGSVVVTDGGVITPFATGGEILIGHDPGNRDQIVISISTGGRGTLRFDMTAYETTGALFSSNDLPALPDMSGFESVTGTLFVTEGESVDYEITTSTDVPEPASLAVLGFGLTALAGMRRRNRR